MRMASVRRLNSLFEVEDNFILDSDVLSRSIPVSGFALGSGITTKAAMLRTETQNHCAARW